MSKKDANKKHIDNETFLGLVMRNCSWDIIGMELGMEVAEKLRRAADGQRALELLGGWKQFESMKSIDHVKVEVSALDLIMCSKFYEELLLELQVLKTTAERLEFPYMGLFEDVAFPAEDLMDKLKDMFENMNKKKKRQVKRAIEKAPAFHLHFKRAYNSLVA